MEDAKSDPAKSAAIAKKMIESDKVLGIFGLGLSSSQLPVFELAAKAGVPVVCGYTCAVNTYKVKPGSVDFCDGSCYDARIPLRGFCVCESRRDATIRRPRKLRLSGYATPGGRIWTEWTKERLQKDG